MPEPLTAEQIAEAKRLCSQTPSLSFVARGRQLVTLQFYSSRALAELEALRAERDASTAPAVPLILRDRKPPRPQRRKRG